MKQLLLPPPEVENARYKGSIQWADNNAAIDKKIAYQCKAVCIEQTEHIIQCIQEYLDTGEVDGLGYSAPGAIYQLIEDLRKVLKTEVEK